MKNNNKLRIVSNGAEFRIQKQYIVNKLSSEFETKKRFGFVRDIEFKIKPSENWYFVDETGDFTAFWFTGKFEDSFCPINFNTKKEALNWIKQKYGQQGLDSLAAPDWNVV